MKQYFVTNTCLNTYLHMMGFDANREVHTSNGSTRFYYDDTVELREAIDYFKNEDFWINYVASSKVIDNARYKARIAFREQKQARKAI